jgi:hypothetical protein
MKLGPLSPRRTANKLKAALQADNHRLRVMQDPESAFCDPQSPRIKVSLPKLNWMTRPPIPEEVTVNGKLTSGHPPHDDDRALVAECAEAVRLTLMTSAVRAILEAGDLVATKFRGVKVRDRGALQQDAARA